MRSLTKITYHNELSTVRPVSNFEFFSRIFGKYSHRAKRTEVLGNKILLGALGCPGRKEEDRFDSACMHASLSAKTLKVKEKCASQACSSAFVIEARQNPSLVSWELLLFWIPVLRSEGHARMTLSTLHGFRQRHVMEYK